MVGATLLRPWILYMMERYTVSFNASSVFASTNGANSLFNLIVKLITSAPYDILPDKHGEGRKR